jgi:hypothetical protein
MGMACSTTQRRDEEYIIATGKTEGKATSEAYA